MPYKFIVVDDEPYARKLILSHTRGIEGLECAGEYGNATDAANALRSGAVDLVFLDIELPEINGLKLIETLKHPPAIILTTAYRDYAIDAFEADAVDYLLKPISFDRLLKAVNRFFERKSTVFGAAVIREDDGFLFVKSNRKLHKIRLADIVLIESLDEFVKIHTTTSVTVTRENISTLASRLNSEKFVRIHRSFIVAIASITSISVDGVEAASRVLPFGRAFKLSALSKLGISQKR
jgi:DNA-binding LytR/AlgR family response regulator